MFQGFGSISLARAWDRGGGHIRLLKWDSERFLSAKVFPSWNDEKKRLRHSLPGNRKPVVAETCLFVMGSTTGNADLPGRDCRQAGKYPWNLLGHTHYIDKSNRPVNSGRLCWPAGTWFYWGEMVKMILCKLYIFWFQYVSILSPNKIKSSSRLNSILWLAPFSYWQYCGDSGRAA